MSRLRKCLICLGPCDAKRIDRWCPTCIKGIWKAAERFGFNTTTGANYAAKRARLAERKRWRDSGGET